MCSRGCLFCEDLNSVPEGKFVSPVIGAVGEGDVHLLTAEAGEVDIDIAPGDFAGIVSDVGLEFGLSID